MSQPQEEQTDYPEYEPPCIEETAQFETLALACNFTPVSGTCASPQDVS